MGDHVTSEHGQFDLTSSTSFTLRGQTRLGVEIRRAPAEEGEIRASTKASSIRGASLYGELFREAQIMTSGVVGGGLRRQANKDGVWLGGAPPLPLQPDT